MTEQALLRGGFALHRVLLCSPHTDRLPREVQSSPAPEKISVASHHTHFSTSLVLAKRPLMQFCSRHIEAT